MRWNCKAGRCGSCSAEVNGKPRLMCMTRMSHFPEGEPITVVPMKSFPVIKDLVTDVSWNFRGGGEKAPAAQAPPARRRRHLADAAARHRSHPGVSGSASSASSARTCVTSSAITTRRTPSSDRASSSRPPGSTCTRSTRSIGASSPRTSTGPACATSPKCCTEVCPEGIRLTDNAIIPLVKERLADTTTTIRCGGGCSGRSSPSRRGGEAKTPATLPADRALADKTTLAGEQARERRRAWIDELGDGSN